MAEQQASLPQLGVTTAQGIEIPADILAKLSKAEQDKASAFVEQLDATDASAMRMYGAAEQGALASFVDMALPVMLATPADGASKAVGELKTQLRRWDARCDTKGLLQRILWAILPGFQLSQLRSSFSRTYPAMEQTADQLFDARVSLMRLVVQLEKLQKENEARFDRLTAYVALGKLKLKRMQADPRAQESLDWQDAIKRLDVRIHDLQLSRQISLQVAAQIAILLSSSRLAEQQLNTTLTSTIPLWKTQAMILLGMKQQEVVSKAQQDAQQALNQSMAEGTATIETTLKRHRAQKLHTENQQLEQSIDTFNGTLQQLTQNQVGARNEIGSLREKAAPEPTAAHAADAAPQTPTQ